MKPSVRFVATGIAISLASAGAGAIIAVTTPWSSPVEEAVDLAEEPAQADLDYGANARLEPASIDPNVEFPSALSELPNPPTHLAVDPKSGELWFLMFQYGGGTNDLYRYRATDGTLEKRSIPASTGSEFFSAVAVDTRGHVISAEGNSVLDIDPAGGHKELPLPAPANLAKQQGWEGTYVIDMVLTENGRAYLTRMNTAAVTELDVVSGDVREIPLSSDLGQFYFIEEAGKELWLTTWADTTTAPSQTVTLNPTSGFAKQVTLKTVALAADGRGQLYASTQGASSMVRADTNESPLVLSDAEKALSGINDFLAVDEPRGRVWLAGGDGIASVDTLTGHRDYYGLPSWAETAPLSVPAYCLFQECEPGGRAITSVGGIAVSPNGDVYFSDKSFNRIGVVHPR